MSPLLHSSSGALLAVLVLAAALLSGGCRGKGRRPVVPIQGELVYKAGGKESPARGAVLTFYLQNDPEPLPLHPSTRVGEDGGFQVSTYDRNDGLPEGEYVVTVRWRKWIVEMNEEREHGPDLLSGKYSDPKTSTLRATVKKGMGPLRLEVE
jgi:hypothetical protein